MEAYKASLADEEDEGVEMPLRSGLTAPRPPTFMPATDSQMPLPGALGATVITSLDEVQVDEKFYVPKQKNHPPFDAFFLLRFPFP